MCERERLLHRIQMVGFALIEDVYKRQAFPAALISRILMDSYAWLRKTVWNVHNNPSMMATKIAK